MRIGAKGTLALLAVIIGVPIITYNIGVERNPAHQQTASSAKATTSAWSGQDNNVAVSIAQSHCKTYTVVIKNQSRDSRPWQVLVDNKLSASGTMSGKGAAPTQHIPLKAGTMRLAVKYGNNSNQTTLFDQLVSGTQDC
jgi:hypothetical protein